VAYAKTGGPFGKPLASNQAIQFPLVELHTQDEMLRVAGYLFGFLKRHTQGRHRLMRLAY